MKSKCANIAILILFIAFFSFQITGCGSSEGDSTTTDTNGDDTNGDITVVLDKISLGTSQVSVMSDNLDFATITSTVLDTNNAVVEGVTVSFSANDGQISYASVDTDENGKAEITFSSGTDKSSRVATITAQVTGLSTVQIPIQITGTTISLSTDSTNIAVGGSPATLTISVLGVDDVGVPGSLVTLSAEPAGVVTLSQYTGDTDTSGNLEVDITGVAAGSVTVTVQALGVTDTQDYIVGTPDEVFYITKPTDDPYSLSTDDDPLNIEVNVPAVPATIPPTQQLVQFATTIGTWDGGTELVVTKTVSEGTASADLTSSEAGTANVQVLDAADPLVTDSLTVIFSVPSDDATQIALQASATIVAPIAEDGTKSSVTLIATVKNATDQVVGDAAVAFSIVNPTGGGETIFPVVAYTNAYGVANSTFTSGSLSTDNEGVEVKVTVVSDTSITDTINIVIGGTAGSVVIGRGTVIEPIDDDTAYKLPMSVLVADSNGNPVASATVSLGAWPLQYSTGYWIITPDGCVPVVTGTYDNEDANRNLILDEDEDTGSSGDPCDGDGQLTPLSSAAGSLPATVTTDENGVANFDLVYLKQYATWIFEEIRASTLVLGTETTSILEFTLPYLEDDACSLPHSPYGSGIPEICTITASSIGFGWISPSGEVEVDYGDDQLFIITPYSDDVSSVWVDGELVGTDLNSYLFENVTEDHTIDVVFVGEETFTIEVNDGPNGSISPSWDQEVAYGDNQTFIITPYSGYVSQVWVDSELVGEGLDSYLFENVTEDHSIDVSFVWDGPDEEEIFTITATITTSADDGTSDDNGTIVPWEPDGDNQISVKYGDDQVFVITPDEGYVPSVLVDGWPATEELTQELNNYYYIFENVTEDHTIEVTFVVR